MLEKTEEIEAFYFTLENDTYIRIVVLGFS